MKAFSKAAADEIRELSRSADMRKDMAAIAQGRHNPFLKDGEVDCDAFIAFVAGYNEFINHEPKRFIAMVDKDMRL